MIYSCCDDRRRRAIETHPTLNGIDFLEVRDDDSIPEEQRQKTLDVHFVKPLTAGALKKGNVRIDGGERIKNIAVVGASIGTGSHANILTADVDARGDFSIYTLRLVKAFDNPETPDGFDPLSSAVEFSFKVDCPSDFDCEPTRECPPEERVEPDINYLAKDYGSFRQLMLDRMAVLMPQWRERNPADLGVALVELLAYKGDYLSYQQDAVGTEAYLGTARRRISVRRHARLVDYFMHDGCNARTWVHVQVNADNVLLPHHTPLLTKIPQMGTVIAPGSDALEHALKQNPQVFETMSEARLFQAHNQISFYTWGARECCLPQGATSATLAGKLTNLQVGDVLIFEEVLGPETGQPEDADPAHRHAVRLTSVTFNQDLLGGQFVEPPNNNAVDVTEIEWGNEDALPFPLCVSVKLGQEEIPDVSVARGNIVLADHGISISEDSICTVPAPRLFRVVPSMQDRCEERVPTPIPARFNPSLANSPLTFAPPYDESGSARAAVMTLPADALPELALESVYETRTAEWMPKRDMLNSGPDKTEFVVEVEADSTAYLRFGDGQHGYRPDAGTKFSASYRVGNGTAGNVGADSITHVVRNDSALVAIRNPLAARGGVDPETIEDVRQRAPFAFRTQERAVTPDDYARMTERNDEVQRAAATFRWTGSWRTVFVSVDRLGGTDVDAAFEQKIVSHLEKYRMAGHDLEVDAPRLVSLEVELFVCVKPDYFRTHVQAGLLEVFSNRILPDGRRGVFHPDNFTFGQPVYLSKLYAAAQAVEGVDSVQVTVFQRQGITSNAALDAGKLELGRLEIARLDNDPNFPEHGVFRLKLDGGK